MEIERLRDMAALLGIDVFADAETRIVPLNELKLDKGRNPRDETTAYERSSHGIQVTEKSIRAQGFLPSKPLVVNLDPDGKYDILCGALRYTVAGYLGLRAVPCLVLKGLSEEQKLVLIHDHDQEESQGEIGRLKSVRNCMEAGLSRSATAEKLQWLNKKGSPNMSKVQKYEELIGLPQYVQDQWMELQRDPLSKKLEMIVDTEVIRHLTEMRNLDKKEGHFLPNGPNLTAEIAKVKATGVTTKAEKKSNALTPTNIEGLGDAAENFIFKEFCYGLAGKKGANHVIAGRKILEALDLVYPNPKPVDAPKTVEEIFSENTVPENTVPENTVPENTVPENTVPEPEPVEIISEGTRKSRRR